MEGGSSQIRIFEVVFCWQTLKIAFEDSVTKSKAGYDEKGQDGRVSGVQPVCTLDTYMYRWLLYCQRRRYIE
jgi:hypothetical protein